MNQFKSNPTKTILVIVTGLLTVFLFTKYEILLNISLVLALIGVLFKKLSYMIEVIWFKIGFLLSLFVPKVVLILIFYLILFPVALLSRISSKDPLILKKSSNSTYKSINKTFKKQSFINTW
tara:strand:- start:189 stop:554 length:366 start_codon:yes stop_codon:yes gene_type:complete